MDASREDTEHSRLIERLRLLGEVYATQTAVFQQQAAASLGLGVTDSKALSILLREGPQTAGALMTRLNLTSGAVTGLVDRLDRKGLAHRHTDPADRRRVIVSVDTEALASRPSPYTAIGAAFDDLHSTYSTADLTLIEAYLEASTRITREQAEALHH
ncbi:MAG TPA: MarR family transcriptional regulator [Propionicimonas sp.]|jgi:DNA-binding MarR family transcriptional regulator|uniref:MarR family winged helix-turn-helix transcriptional regulator n=1 Tax=Propionicimonas sp. TaxID=1955623 RepID=UPI002F42DF2D